MTSPQSTSGGWFNLLPKLQSPLGGPTPALTKSGANAAGMAAIVVEGNSFALHGDNMSYRFHVDSETRDLVSDHFGGPADSDGILAPVGPVHGWLNWIARVRREFPDLGRGDFRSPAVQIRQSEGHTVSEFTYQGYDIVKGKPTLGDGLPATFGAEDEVYTLVVHMLDKNSSVAADLTYSVFPKHDAIARSVKITNKGSGDITVDRLSSFSVDMPYCDYDMIELRGEWARETSRVQRHVEYGTQGFASSTGYSSHLHNPFLALVDPKTTETTGEAWGFSLIYSGSFAAEVEKSPHGPTRVQIGLNPCQLSWKLEPGESLTSPEAVSVYSAEGVGGMSRRYHRMYRKNLMKSKFATEPRPALLNSWEGLFFDFDQDKIYRLARESAELGVKLFVLDDGWFGVKYPRVDDHAGLGDWQANPDRFPKGLTPLVKDVTALKAANSSANLQFGLWIEPEMVNPNSTLYKEHPEWALHAGSYPRSETRFQLVLNVALPEVQDFIIDAVDKILRDSPITYIKWDMNRGVHETPSPMNNHKYQLGLYRVFEVLTSRFPNVLWEGCASGGGRFDPAILQWFPQVWTSDNTDAVDRLPIQFGTSLVYPPSAMGAHISAVPSGNSLRTTSITYRAHVAMMGGSFGLELDPAELDESDRAQIPGLIAQAEKVNPIVVDGDFYRLNLPEESQYPAAMFVSQDGSKAVVFYFSTKATVNHGWPQLRLQGLDPKAKYKIDGDVVHSGAALMSIGIGYWFIGDYDSKVIFLERQ